MPSKALTKFEKKMLVDVNRIVASHATLNHSGGGRRGLGHLTRSGVLMLCASWELYIEELAVEISDYLSARAGSPKDFPIPVQKELAKTVKEHKHELRSLEMAGSGWKDLYKSLVKAEVAKINTPKAAPIDELYLRNLGWKSPSVNWSRGASFIDEFVSTRGDIAHRGSDSVYVNINRLRDLYLKGVYETALEHDNAACDFVNNFSAGGRPWRIRT